MAWYLSQAGQVCVRANCASMASWSHTARERPARESPEVCIAHNIGRKLSGPGDLFVFKLSIASSISFKVTVQVSKEGNALIFSYSKLGISDVSSIVKTELKNLFKISHFSWSLLVSSPSSLFKL